MRVKIAALAFVLLGAQAVGASQNDEPSAGTPRTGQPAADVLASHDSWGNPTFIGGLTNAGPTSHSVW